MKSHLSYKCPKQAKQHFSKCDHHHQDPCPWTLFPRSFKFESAIITAYSEILLQYAIWCTAALKNT